MPFAFFTNSDAKRKKESWLAKENRINKLDYASFETKIKFGARRVRVKLTFLETNHFA